MTSDAPHANPFPGLRPFEADEAHLFFGRDGQSDELLRQLLEHRFVAVLGTSGSGKSSLIRAGLLHSLYAGFMPGVGSRWRVVVMRPGLDPIRNLAEALSRRGVLQEIDEEQDPDEALLTEAVLRRGALGLIERVLEARLSPDQNVLVIVDQFEEVFRVQQNAGSEFREQAAALVGLLLEATSQREVPIYMLLAMRSDYLGDCAQFRNLPEAINRAQYLIPRMTRSQREMAVMGPVRVGGASITARLVSRLLNDAGDDPDQLPVLQHALMRTWEYWAHNHADEPIDLLDYETIGGWKEALSRHANEAYDDLDSREQILAERIFRRLTEKGPDNREIRRPTRLGELCAVAEATEEETKRIIAAFRAPGRSFLTPAPPTPLVGTSLIDISHESLIRGWDRLKQWVEAEAELAREYQRLADDAARYERKETALLRDPTLTRAVGWWTENQPNEAWARVYDPRFAAARDFLEESCRAHNAERRRRRWQRRAIVGGLSIAVIVFAALAWRLAQAKAHEQRELLRVEELEALKLYAVMAQDTALLKALTSHEPYYAGYLAFRSGDYNAARTSLEASIQEGRYIPSSNYLLAFMSYKATLDAQRKPRPGSNYSEALQYLQRAIEADPNYAPAYYLRAIIQVKTGEINSAMSDLDRAVTGPIGYLPCGDLNDPSEVDSVFLALKGQQRFEDLRQRCKLIHNIK